MATTTALPVQNSYSHLHLAGALASVAEQPASFLTDEYADKTGVAVDAVLDVTEFMPMVRAVARRMHRRLPQHVELEDLVSAGYLGLLDAAEKFRVSRQTHFRSYAEFRVRGAILDALRDLDAGSRTLRRNARRIEAATGVLSTKLGRRPEEAEVAAELSIGVTELRQTRTELRGLETASLQMETGDEDGIALLDCMADASAKDPLTLYLDAEFKQRLVDAIEALAERERLVITLSYHEELTLKEIGEVLNVTESRAAQLRSAAIGHLKAALMK